MNSIKYYIMLAIAKNAEGLPVATLIELIAPTPPEKLFLLKNTSYL